MKESNNISYPFSVNHDKRFILLIKDISIVSIVIEDHVRKNKHKNYIRVIISCYYRLLYLITYLFNNFHSAMCVNVISTFRALGASTWHVIG